MEVGEGANPTGSGITDGSPFKQVRSSALAWDERMGMKGHCRQGGEDSALGNVLRDELLSRQLFSFSIKKQWQWWLNQEARGLVPF